MCHQSALWIFCLVGWFVSFCHLLIYCSVDSLVDGISSLYSSVDPFTSRLEFQAHISCDKGLVSSCFSIANVKYITDCGDVYNGYIESLTIIVAGTWDRPEENGKWKLLYFLSSET